MTVDPFNITKYDRTDAELEELLFFCVVVPGHNAKTTSASLDKFLAGKRAFEFVRRITGGSPFKSENESLVAYAFRSAWSWRRLMKSLEAAGIGCRTRVSRSLWELSFSGLDLRTCSVGDLEKIHGVGRKTSRFFTVHSRKEPGDVAILDVHILHYLDSMGHKVPKHTPTSKKQYEAIEKIFVEYAKKSGKTLAEFDLELWKAGAQK